MVELLKDCVDGLRRLRIGEMVNADGQGLFLSINDKIGILGEKILYPSVQTILTRCPLFGGKINFTETTGER